MGIDDAEVTRLLRGDVPNDDPVWGEVSSFLNDVGTAYPAVPTTAFEGRHLEAVARESRLVHSELRHPRQSAVKRMFGRTRRVLAGSMGAIVIVLTAGVGVASALGINPLAQLIHPRPAPSVAPQATMRTAGTDDPADGNDDREPGAVSPRAVPSSDPSSTPSSSQDAQAAKDAEKAAKEAAKAAEKAAKEAAKQAAKDKAKAKKEAEKAAREAEKAAKEAGKDKGKGGNGAAEGDG